MVKVQGDVITFEEWTVFYHTIGWPWPRYVTNKKTPFYSNSYVTMKEERVAVEKNHISLQNHKNTDIKDIFDLLQYLDR